MLISFTGAQSSGKTTSLRHWNDRSDRLVGCLSPNLWNVVPEVTRKLKRRGFEINDGGDNYTDTQIAILTDHLNNIFAYSNTDMDTILDRCIVDGFIYTRYFRMEGKVDEFTDRIFSYMLSKYIVFFILVHMT